MKLVERFLNYVKFETTSDENTGVTPSTPTQMVFARALEQELKEMGLSGVWFKEVTKRADILVVAIGKPKFIDASYVKDGAVVIDVGIHRMEDGKLCGDVDYASVEPVASAITPVPGGVGPMTIAMLMYNCLSSVCED